MINTAKLEQLTKENKLVVVHSFDKVWNKLLYKGDNEILASDMYHSYSGKTRMFRDGEEIKVR